MNPSFFNTCGNKDFWQYWTLQMTAYVSIAIYILTLKENKNKENILQTRDKMQGFIQNTLFFKKTAIYKHPPLQKSNIFKFSYEQCSGEITSLKPGSIHIFTLFFLNSILKFE